jgi:hypothetical protein
MPLHQEYAETIAVLRAAQAYADELEPRFGERVDSDRMRRWCSARQLVRMLQASADRLARELANSC